MRPPTPSGELFRSALVTALSVALLVCAVPTAAQDVRAFLTQRKALSQPTSDAAKKIGSPLRTLIGEFRSEGITSGNARAMNAGRRFSSTTLRVDDRGRVQVYVYVTDASDAALDTLRLYGLDIEIVNTDFGIAQGWLSVENLEPLAAEALVVRIRPPSYGVPQAGSVTTQGDASHRCDQVRSSTGLTGAGIKVGVISGGVDGLAAAQASGNLPAVQVLSSGAGDAEGTAMLEIVHDCTPGAALAFAAGSSTSLAFIAAVNMLRDAGARIIVDDILFVEAPFFEDGLTALNDRVVGTSVLRVTAAGNYAKGHYQGMFAPHFLDPDFHDFGGSDFLLLIAVPPLGPGTIVLQWGNPFGAASDDYDMCASDALSGTILNCSSNIQNGNDNPVERLDLPCFNLFASCLVNISVIRFSGSPRLLELTCFTCEVLEHRVVTDGVFGHAAVPEVLAVAAADWHTPSVIDPYSSRGPSTIFYPAPQIRSKPDVTAVDCVATSRPPGPLNPFCGTSAAAPHVAAIAALVLQRNPTLTPAQVRDVLRNSAVDLGPVGFDVDFGYGRADAVNAVNATPLPAPPPPPPQPERRLTVTLAGTSGSVLSQPAGVACGVDCTELYAHGTTVTLTASPVGTSTFAGWSGGGCSGTGPCVVTLTSDVTVTATFSLLAPVMTSPANGTHIPLVAPTPVGFAWPPMAGASRYLFEFTLPNRVFVNPNSVTLDALNSGGSLQLITAGFSVVLDPSFPHGTYQVRVRAVAFTGAPIGVFSNAVTLILGIPPTAQPSITGPFAGSVLHRGVLTAFSWSAVPGAAQYRFDYTGPGGLIGSFAVPGPGFTAVIPTDIPLGMYEVRITALSGTGTPGGLVSQPVSVFVQ